MNAKPSGNVVTLAVAACCLALIFYFGFFRKQYVTRAYVFPNGFHGAYEVIEDETLKGLLPVEGARVVIKFDSSGVKHLSPEAFKQITNSYAFELYSYEDGTPIADEIPGTDVSANAVASHIGHGSQVRYWTTIEHGVDVPHQETNFSGLIVRRYSGE